MDVAPELVVEVMSPDDTWREVTQKLTEYFEIGVCMVLIAEPKTEQIFAYRSLEKVQIFKPNDTLVIEDILPEFRVTVASLFQDA